MPHWKLKALIQGSISRLPDAQRWNRLLQKYITRSLELDDEYLISKWQQALRHTQNYRRHTGNSRGFSALELGTGWFPINPIGLALSGASPVYTIDRQVLFQREQLVQVLDRFQALADKGLVELVAEGASERLRQTLDASQDQTLKAQDLLQMLGIRSIVGDARAMCLETASIDLVCSNNTLEHIPADTIAAIFREFHRLLKRRGLMSHHIDLSDHYSHFDSSISVYNFLQFPEVHWQRYNNDLLYQNRLRLSDYMALHRETAWRVIDEDSLRKPIEALRAVHIADEFRHYDESDLAVYNCWILSKPEVSES